jgi:group I intron endonuclease
MSISDIELLLSGNIHAGSLKRTLGFTGKTHSEETRAKIGAASKTRIHSHRFSFTGKTHSEETRAKMSASLKGSRFGGRHSEETCAKISASLKGRRVGGALGNNGKSFMTPSGLFVSRSAAARALNINFDRLGRLMKRFPNEYYYA